MNQQWMTILLSKGIELEQNLRSKLENVQEQVETQLKKQLESRGVRLSPTDLAALLESVSPKMSRVALSYALDVIRPFSTGMGFRISNLADDHIELVIPNRTRNQNEFGFMHEAAVLAGVSEAAKLLWMRHADGDMSMQIQNIEMSFHKQTQETLRVRIELLESHREAVLADLRQNQNSVSNMAAIVFDENRQTIAEVNIKLNLHMGLTLSSNSSDTKM